jgi:hypothetical protein
MKRKLLLVVPLALAMALGGLAWIAASPGDLASLLVGEEADAQGLAVTQAAPFSPTTPTGGGFTYQGRLTSSGSPTSGQYDLRFSLFSDLTAGSQVGSPITFTNHTVANGLFTVVLDFGAGAFQGDARYLQIEVKQTGGPTYSTLAPRQALTPAPYALFALKTQGYRNVVVVAQAGGDYTSIQAALNGITDATATNRYLVKVAPGTYTETVTMKQYVDIEGSGEKTTKITSAATLTQNSGTVVGASNAELRLLTVENSGGDFYGIAVYNDNASPSLLHVTVNALNASSINYGVININSSAPRMTDMTVLASGATSNNYGVINSSSSPEMVNVTVAAVGGGSNFGVSNDASGGTMSGGVITASGGSFAAGVSNYSSSTTTMMNVTVVASGASSASGISNSSSSVAMIDVIVVASGGSAYTQGVNNEGSSPRMINVTVDVSGGGGVTYGVRNFYSSPRMTNVTAGASGGFPNYGVYNYEGSPAIEGGKINAYGPTGYGVYNVSGSGSYVVTIDNATVSGVTNTIYNDVNYTTRVGSTKLDGGAAIANGGSLKCAGVHDEGYGFHPGPTCP